MASSNHSVEPGSREITVPAGNVVRVGYVEIVGPATILIHSDGSVSLANMSAFASARWPVNEPKRSRLCRQIRYDISGNYECILPEGHVGSEHLFEEHNCRDCGTKHGTCRDCGSTHGESHATGCIWMKLGEDGK